MQKILEPVCCKQQQKKIHDQLPGPLFHKPVTGQELFSAVSYTKLALEIGFKFTNTDLSNFDKL